MDIDATRLRRKEQYPPGPERMRRSDARMPQTSRPMAGRVDVIQDLKSYFSRSRADTIAAFHPVSLFMGVVGTILVPKANEFSHCARCGFRRIRAWPEASDLPAAFDACGRRPVVAPAGP